MQDIEGLLAESHRVAILEPAIGLEGLEPWKPEALALLGQLPDPEGVLALRALDRDRMALRKFGRLPAVVDMAVGQQHLLDAGAELREPGVDPVEVAARIDHRGAAAGLAEQDRAVLRERGYRNDHQLHGAPARDGVRGGF